MWILDNAKHDDRKGTVQLIDASAMWERMRKGMGDKKREIPEKKRDEIVKLYDNHEETERSKVLTIDEFGYWTITVERALLDDDGEIVRDRRGPAKADTKKRDTERVPFTYGGNTLGEAGKDTTISAYFSTEVAPHVPDAWIDHKKTKTGFEIPFSRIFYTYEAPRSLEEIDRDLEAKIAKILNMLREVEA